MRSRTITLLLAAAIAGTGCSDPAPERTTMLRPVRTHLVAEPSANVKRSFSGVTQATDSVDLGFEVGGRVIQVAAEQGLRYGAGEVLAILDSTGYRAELNNASGQYAAADANLQRTLRLYENANASKSQLDSAMATRATAKANLDVATKRMADTALRMPYPGVVGRVAVSNQQVLSPGQAAVTIHGEAGMEMEIGVPARLIDQIQVGLLAEVRLGALPGLVQPGRVSGVSPQIPRNTTYLVTVAFDAPIAETLEGMDGEATLDLSNPAGEIVKVPLACVAANQSGSAYVWIVKAESGQPDTPPSAIVERRTVTIGNLHDEGFIEILDGLAPGDTVLSRGVHRVEDGQRVRLD